MKIACIGSAPASLTLAPYGDPSWEIWGCSPAVYPVAGRITEWFEIHRWEPPIVGNAARQVPWLSPEYVQWMAKQKSVWMFEPVPEIPGSKKLPVSKLIAKYGHFFFTSSVAWMLAMAIDKIQASGETENAIGLWGVDMAATEEWGAQRQGCQFFIQMASSLGIQIILPPESDLMMPAPLYGIFESSHRAIKFLARRKELANRMQMAEQQVVAATQHAHFLKGAVDDMDYHMQMWMHDGPAQGADFERIFGDTAVTVSGETEVHAIPPLILQTAQNPAETVTNKATKKAIKKRK